MSEMSTRDADHLRLLGIFHFVVAGLAFLFALFPIFHLILGVAMVSGGLEPSGGEDIPVVIGWIFVMFSGLWMAFGTAFAIAMIIAGRSLLAHRHHTFCLVMAAIACAFTPFGTVLGVFTIVVLMKDSVRQLFDHSSDRQVVDS